MSRLAKDLFSMFKFLTLLRNSSGFLICELLIKSSRGNCIIVKDFAMLWEAVPIPEITGRKEMAGL